MSEQQSALFPTYARFPITLVKGEGSRLWDDKGKEYLDFASGLAVTNLGHVPKRVKEKLVEQLGELWHVSNLFHIPNQEKLARLLVDNSCADAVFFCNSGAEANEAAIKLARRYNAKVLGKPRHEIITFHTSFHGRTLATLTATGQDKVKEGFHPLPEGFVYAPYNDADALKSYVTDKTCAIMLELVQGEGGVNPASEAFVQEAVRLCKEHDLLLIIDEIQTGMGRTGKLFAYEHYGIEPDIFTLAKGLASGFPIGAMLGKAKLRDAFTAGSHGSTFGGTPIATAAGIATVETMVEEKVPQRAAELGAYFMEQLNAKLAGNPLVKQIRGKGLLLGIECTRPASEFIPAIHEAGLLVSAAGPNVIRLLPNLLVTHEEADRGIDIVAGVLAQKAAAAVQ
ncbi:acetylornithine transaminase [Paenibacillus flagellatus]|uniref:Acetylornithine aminotransferase n=1 Tax=Paenibacillus flagellatus TaxID=2211139 RepID=A0A2V5K0L1_9BACL|nr:acetylornithine transaminase [Paenibacillus flagellatus]PYI51194.1 acetylornithine transaminase [Paenibacillus flagellatus]